MGRKFQGKAALPWRKSKAALRLQKWKEQIDTTQKLDPTRDYLTKKLLLPHMELERGHLVEYFCLRMDFVIKMKCNHNVVLHAYNCLFLRKCDFAGLFCVPL